MNIPLFDPVSQALIQNWDQSIEKQIQIKLITPDHAEDPQFINFTTQFAKETSHLWVEPQKKESDLPGFLLTENIIYSALPLKKELAPFLEALSQINGPPLDLSKALGQALERIDVPVRLTLYIALECPHCPHVVRTLIPLALNCTHINLHIIDGSLFPQTAQKNRILSVPCLILDDDFRWTGKVSAEEIVTMITSRDPSQLSARTLKTILEQGDAAWITRQMIKKKKIFDGFITLLVHDTWSVRLGALVVVEELVETDPGLAASLCPLLISLFDTKDIPIQGDILYALGEAGDTQTQRWLEKKQPELVHQDLVDAATEALDSLKSKKT